MSRSLSNAIGPPPCTLWAARVRRVTRIPTTTRSPPSLSQACKAHGRVPKHGQGPARVSGSISPKSHGGQFPPSAAKGSDCPAHPTPRTQTRQVPGVHVLTRTPLHPRATPLHPAAAWAPEHVQQAHPASPPRAPTPGPKHLPSVRPEGKAALAAAHGATAAGRAEPSAVPEPGSPWQPGRPRPPTPTPATSSGSSAPPRAAVQLPGCSAERAACSRRPQPAGLGLCWGAGARRGRVSGVRLGQAGWGRSPPTPATRHCQRISSQGQELESRALPPPTTSNSHL